MNDPEIRAISEITKSLESLDEEQRRNVLAYVSTRYNIPAVLRSAPGPPVANIEGHSGKSEEFADVGDLFDASGPQAEAERVLVVAYWLQVVEGRDSFEAFAVTRQLKHLGHPVSNITRALDSMMNRAPRLVLQISKSGSTKQARKRYKITREGIKRVREMLLEANGETNAD